MHKNLDVAGRIVRFVAGVFFLLIAYALFRHFAARILFGLLGLLWIFEALLGKCWLYAKLGQTEQNKPLTAEALYLLGLFGVQVALAYEWWSAGWEKISNPDFVGGMTKTLEFFASKNSFQWFKNFLLGSVLPNAKIFGYVVEWSQIVIAITMILMAVIYVYSKSDKVKRVTLVLSLLALFGGMLMNASFYLAASWTGPGTKAANVVMFWPQAILAYIWFSALVTKRFTR